MLFPIVLIGITLILLERVFPDQTLPESKGWWGRVTLINLFQLGIIYVAANTWDGWFFTQRIFQFDSLPAPLSGLISYFVVTLIFYWWHRFRHEVNWLWLCFHQVHHSPRRIETITSFYKHPLEIIVNSWIMGTINFILMGVSLDAAAWCLFYSSLGEYFYHMNIATPQWVGYFFQRPEMHRIHHQRNKHYGNFSDLPIWDMLFGTYQNPPTYQGECGFKPEREPRLVDMLCFKNVNNPYPNQKRG